MRASAYLSESGYVKSGSDDFSSREFSLSAINTESGFDTEDNIISALRRYGFNITDDLRNDLFSRVTMNFDGKIKVSNVYKNFEDLVSRGWITRGNALIRNASVSRSRPRRVSIDVYCVDGSTNMRSNLDKIINGLARFTSGVSFDIGSFNTRAYMPEVPYNCLVINGGEFILTNDENFRLGRYYSSDADFEDLSQFFLSCLEAGCDFMLR